MEKIKVGSEYELKLPSNEAKEAWCGNLIYGGVENKENKRKLNN